MPDDPRRVELIDCGYRTRCASGGERTRCSNLAKAIARTVDHLGRPLRQGELCRQHVTSLILYARAVGLEIHDKRSGRTEAAFGRE
jgi:hypothetical protein